MWVDLSIFCFIIAVSIPGAKAGEEQAISDSGIIALTTVLAILLIVFTLAIGCYCYRKHTIETKAARRKKLQDIQTFLTEKQAGQEFNMQQVGNTYINGGIPPDRIKTYGEWRKSQRSSNLYTTTSKTYTTSNYRVRRGSTSPPQSPRSPGYERGRTVQRRYAYEMPAGSVAVRRTAVRPQIRSKSAPAYARYRGYNGYNVVHPRYVRTGYTRDHYLSIKKPFGKRFILPPTLVYREQPTFIQKTISVPEYQPSSTHITQKQVVQVPQPPREVIKGDVYHVKFEAGRNQTVVSSNNYSQKAGSTSGYTYHSNDYGQNQASTSGYTYSSNDYGQKVAYTSGYSTVTDQPYRDIHTSTSTYGRTYQAEPYPVRTYTSKVVDGNYDLVNEKTNVYTIATSGAAHQSFWENGTEGQKTTVIYANEGDTGESFRRSITSSVVRVSNRAEDDEKEFTIIDYVEPAPGTSGNIADTPMSTSTPRFPDQDPTTPSAHLRDLDNALGGDGNATSSSSSSSSSSRSSGSAGN